MELVFDGDLQGKFLEIKEEENMSFIK